MGQRIADKGQQLRVYVAPALPLATADPARIRQVVANLLTDAHLYTDAGGRIHVGVEPDRALGADRADSGIGMSHEERVHVFDRFYRAHNTDESTICATCWPPPCGPAARGSWSWDVRTCK